MEIINIGETSLYINDGNYSSKYPKKSEFIESGVPFISAYNIRNGRIVWNKMKFISREQHDSLQKGHIMKGDVLLITRGSIGAVAYVTDEFDGANINAQLVFLRANEVDISSKYLYYYLSTNEFKGQVLNRSSGTAQPQLPIHQLVNIPIRLYDIKTQRKTADILSAYDDLIENNTRRIKVLEEMAQVIYREWFIHFRFPGHEDMAMVESELGMIPEGWELKAFSEVTYINPKHILNKETKKPHVGMAALTTNSMIVTPEGTKIGNSGSKFLNKDVLFPRITPCVENGKRGYVQFLNPGEVSLGSTEFIVFREKELCSEYLYLLSIQDDFRENAINSMVGASGRQRVQNDCFDNYKLAVPSQNIQDKFSEIASPFFNVIHIFSQKNNVLKSMRDLLLPRLISGDLDASELEIEG